MACGWVSSYLWLLACWNHSTTIVWNKAHAVPQWQSQCQALLLAVSPQHLLSEESDKILKECEKETIPWLLLPQLFLFKDLASLFRRGLFLKASDWILTLGWAVTIYCCHENMNYRMQNLWSRLLSQRELLGPPRLELWPVSEEDGCLEKDGGRPTREELKGKKGVEGRMWDLEGPQPMGVWGRQEEDACCRAK